MATTVVLGQGEGAPAARPADELSLQRHTRRMRVLQRISIYGLVLCGVSPALFPLYWMLITSLAARVRTLRVPPKLIPSTFRLGKTTQNP